MIGIRITRGFAARNIDRSMTAWRRAFVDTPTVIACYRARRSIMHQEAVLADNGAKPTVTIIGAGTGGTYLAAMLGLVGCKVRLHDINDSKLTDLRNAKGIEVEGPSGGFAPLEMATTDLKAAAEGADIFIMATGGTFQEKAAESLAPLLRDGQIILLVQGNTGGALVVRRVLDKAGCKARIDIAEMDNYPMSAWRRAPAKIAPIVVKKGLQIAAFPGTRTDAVFARLGPLFSTSVKAPNIAYTGFVNANAMLHVANCIGNAGLIDGGGNYKFYAEGVTPMIGKLYEAINAERVAVAAALGAKVPDLAEWWHQTYGVREKTLSETAQKLTYNSDGPYQATGTPKSFAHQYVSEDVPVGLIPMSEIGRAVGVPTPAIDAVIKIAGIMAGSDFKSSARTLERMGLAGKDAKGIKAVLESGFGQATA
jgi:opine dehydrogenase